MLDKKKVAWAASDFEGYGAIVFHHHGMAAKRLASQEFDGDIESVQSIRRAPEFDQYAENGFVPVKARIENGWWHECLHCRDPIGHDCDMDMEAVVYDGEDKVFCSMACKIFHASEVKRISVDFEWFKSRVQELRPDLEFTKFRGGYPILTPSAQFTFPGSRHGGSVQMKQDREIEWFMANGDRETWGKYEQQQAGE